MKSQPNPAGLLSINKFEISRDVPKAFGVQVGLAFTFRPVKMQEGVGLRFVTKDGIVTSIIEVE